MEQFNLFYTNNKWALVLVVLWTLFWKGCALWTAGKRDEKKWFLALLILNTVGILEIVYIFYIAKKKWADIKEIATISFSSK